MLLWDLAARQERFVLKGHGTGHLIHSVTFAPDGKTLASASWDGTVRLWHAATAQELMVLRPTRYWVHQVTFGRDGKSLAALSRHPRDEGTDVTIWPAPE